MSNQRDPQPDEYQPSPVHILKPEDCGINSLGMKELYAKGDLSLLELMKKSIPVIGPRNATQEGLHQASLLAQLFLENGLFGTTGGAPGIDQAFHTKIIGQIDSIVWLAHIHDIYEPTNERIEFMRKMAQKNLIIGAFKRSDPNRNDDYLFRNKLMVINSGEFVIGIEPPKSSGSSSALRFAILNQKKVIIISNLHTINTGLTDIGDAALRGQNPYCRVVTNAYDAVSLLLESKSG